MYINALVLFTNMKGTAGGEFTIISLKYCTIIIISCFLKRCNWIHTRVQGTPIVYIYALPKLSYFECTLYLCGYSCFDCNLSLCVLFLSVYSILWCTLYLCAYSCFHRTLSLCVLYLCVYSLLGCSHSLCVLYSFFMCTLPLRLLFLLVYCMEPKWTPYLCFLLLEHFFPEKSVF